MSDRVGAVWGHRLAALLCGATLLLLVFGGLVTNTGSALAVPDWPTTFGQNMFLYPWSRMIGGIFYEHSHRLIGSVVGLLTLGLAAWLWRFESRRWIRGLGLLAVALVSAQGVLGGLRVVLLSERLAVVHGSIAPLFFTLTVVLVLVTSQGWRGALGAAPPAADRVLRRLAFATTGLLYLQTVFGAFLTHLGWLLEAHLAGAAALAVLVPALAGRVLARHFETPALVRPVLWLGALLALQLLLGLGAYVNRFTGFELPFSAISALAVPVIHRVIGAGLLALSVVVCVRVYRPSVTVRSAVSLRQPFLKQVPA